MKIIPISKMDLKKKETFYNVKDICLFRLCPCSILVSFDLIHSKDRFDKQNLYQKTRSLIFKKVVTR